MQDVMSCTFTQKIIGYKSSKHVVFIISGVLLKNKNRKINWNLKKIQKTGCPKSINSINSIGILQKTSRVLKHRLRKQNDTLRNKSIKSIFHKTFQ